MSGSVRDLPDRRARRRHEWAFLSLNMFLRCFERCGTFDYAQPFGVPARLSHMLEITSRVVCDLCCRSLLQTFEDWLVVDTVEEGVKNISGRKEIISESKGIGNINYVSLGLSEAIAKTCDRRPTMSSGPTTKCQPQLPCGPVIGVCGRPQGHHRLPDSRQTREIHHPQHHPPPLPNEFIDRRRVF